MLKVCQYCGQESKNGHCVNCGSTNFGDTPKERICKGQPFYYNGYVVWWLADILTFKVTYLFYLGDRLVENITLSRDILDRFVPKHCDPMSFVWSLFELAQGKEEVLQIVEQNTSRMPAHFEIRYSPSKHEKWIGSLTQRDVEEAIIAGRREL